MKQLQVYFSFFDDGDEETDADGGPDLSFHCVLGGAVKGFDTQANITSLKV